MLLHLSIQISLLLVYPSYFLDKLIRAKNLENFIVSLIE